MTAEGQKAWTIRS